MHIKLYRNIYHEATTLGAITIDGNDECLSLEPTTRAPGVKIIDETAIPFGTYQIIIDYSQRFKKFMPHVLGVPDFLGIRIHPGNSAKDTHGCILVGRSIDGDSITKSVVAYEALFAKIATALGSNPSKPSYASSNPTTGEKCFIEIIDNRSENQIGEKISIADPATA